MYKPKFIVSLLISVSILFFSHLNAQLSMFNKIDTFKGFNTKMIPLGKGFYIVSGPQHSYDSVSFRLSKFDECGNLTSVKDFVSDSITGYFDPDGFAYTQENPENKLDFTVKNFYILLKSEENINNPDVFTLLNFLQDGTLLWAKNIEIDDKSIITKNANILFYSNYLYLVTSDKDGNTVITSLDKDGEVHESRRIIGIDHGSSTIDQEGNIFIFSQDSLYSRVRVNNYSIDSLIWTKKIEDRRFAFTNDPIASETVDEVIMAVIDTNIIHLDTINNIDSIVYHYQLVSFDYNGNITKQSSGYDFESYDTPIELKYLENKMADLGVFAMHKNKVGLFSSTLKPTQELTYDFQKDSFVIVDASLEICIDETLVMSGFCYDDTEFSYDLTSPYVFASKTQKKDDNYEILSEEDTCVNQKVNITPYTLLGIFVSDTILSDSIIELNSKKVPFKFHELVLDDFNEEKCGKVKMEEGKYTPYEVCPFEQPGVTTTTYKGASINWSTGKENSTRENLTKPGIYYVTVSLCDTIKIDTFEYILTDDVKSCFTFYFPNAFTPGDTENEENKTFQAYSKLDSAAVLDSYILRVFDRWGEKVFETNKRFVGWDGTFRGKQMPPGVYLYHMYWEGIFDEKEYKDTYKGQVMLLK